MTGGVLVHLENLDVRYSEATVPALTDLSISVAKGERLAVIGESGSGKTTLALAIANLLPAGAVVNGRIDWPGFGGRPRHGRDIGFVFQDPSASLDPVMRVGGQIAEVVAAHDPEGKATIRERVRELVGQVELPEPDLIAEAYPHQLSGGQRQRVALALALAARPSMLVADEPTSALDPVVQAKLVDLVVRLCDTQKLALVFVTHDIALAAGLGTRLAVIYSTRLVELGPSGRTLSDPAHPYTQALIASHLDPDRRPGGRVFTIDGQPPDPAIQLPGCRFTPRCRRAEADCKIVQPRWIGTGGNGAACIHPLRPIA